MLLSAHPYGKDNLPRRGRRLAGVHPVPGAPPAGPGALLVPDRVGGARPGLVGGPGLRGGQLRPARGRDLGGHRPICSDQEGEDVYDLIEWAAAQPWSTGAVGLVGVSYLAISQWEAAAQQPPSLKAICPWEGLTDPYRDLMLPGGIREDGFVRSSATG